MTRDSQEILVILKPHKILQVVSVIIETLCVGLILISLLLLLRDISKSFLLFFLLFEFLLSVCIWVIINTINTTIVVRIDGILMLGVLLKTYITWDRIEKIQLRYNYKTKSRAVEINAQQKSFLFTFNSKIYFDTNFHRNVRQGTHYILELAKQHNIPVKTGAFSSYQDWKQWARN